MSHGGPVENQRENTIVVTGAGTATAVPDLAQLDLSLEVTDPHPSAAYTEINNVVGRVVAVLDDHGVPEADRQTRAVSLNPSYEHQGGMTATLVGYTATHALRVHLRPSAVTEVLDAMITAAGETLRLHGFGMASTDGARMQADAETAAMADAHDRARRLAGAAGVTLGPVLAVRAEPAPHQQYAVGLGFRASSAVPVQTGTDLVSAQVVVTFALGNGQQTRPHREGDDQ